MMAIEECLCEMAFHYLIPVVLYVFGPYTMYVYVYAVVFTGILNIYRLCLVYTVL